MASNLFGEYFKNPTKSYIYSNIQCNGSDADMSFDIIGSEGVISDSDNSLAHIDLADVHVPVSQYTGNLRILDPYSYMYIKGEYFGETKTSKTFGKIVVDDETPEDWMYRGIIFFVINHILPDPSLLPKKTQTACGRAHSRRVGRPPYAHPFRYEKARLHPLLHYRIYQDRRCFQGILHCRRGAA